MTTSAHRTEPSGPGSDVTPPTNASAPTQAQRPAALCYTAGLVATIAGLGYAAIDQSFLGSLPNHLNRLYDPVGKTGDPGALYTDLYTLGVLGIVGWLLCLRRVRRGARSARRWSWVMLIIGALGTAPLFLTEYGQTVFPLPLIALPTAALLLGLIGTLTLRTRHT